MFQCFRAIKLILFAIVFALPLFVCGQISTPQWVNDIGGPGSSSIPAAVKADKQNNVYISGIYSGTVDFDPSAGVYNLTSVNGSFDTYVAKYTSSGKLIWAVSIGGSGTDQTNTMTLDASGNPTISGQYDADMDADPGPGVFTLHNNGSTDAFVIRFDTNGNLSWAKSIGGSGSDYGDKVASDSNGNIIASIQYQNTVLVGTQSFTSAGPSFNGLIIKYDISGNVLWTVNLSDTGDTEARYSAIDQNDNIVLCGEFSGNVNFNPMGSPLYLNGAGGSSFLAKYSPAGALIWIQKIGGTVVNNNTNLCVNSAGDIFIDGPFSSALNFGANTIIPNGNQDIFIAKYSANGVFQVVKDIGGISASIYNYGIEASLDDKIYLSGYFSGTIDFDPSPTAKALIPYHGQRDLFLVKFDSDINYKWAFGAGNSSCSNTFGRNVAVDNNNDVLLVGSFCSTVNFDASSCSNYNLTASSVRDSFVGKYVQAQASVASQITAFSVPQQSSPAVIDQTNLKITVTVPSGTDVTALIPQISVTANTIVSPQSGVPQNFTSPVTYTLTSGCNLLNYVVAIQYVSPQAIAACPGSTVNLAGSATSQTPDSYLWQLLANGVWTNATGVNSQVNYTTAVLANPNNSNTTYSFCRQTSFQGIVSYDSYYDITLLPPITNTLTPPPLTTFCLNGTPGVIIGSAPSGGNGNYTYQWQISIDNITFTAIAGATTANYATGLLTTTTYYQRMVTSGNCSSTSNVITIQIQTPILNNAITTSSSASTCAIPGSVPTGGTGVFSYQWQSSTDGVNFVNIIGATNQEYDPPPVTSTTYYRRIAVSGSCAAPVTSNVISIQVQSVVANNSIMTSAIVVFCATGNPGVISGSTPTGGNGTYNYQWQSSTDNINFTDVAGATTQDYVPVPFSVSSWFRRSVVSGVCLTPLISNVVNIQVQPALANNVVTAPANTVFCVNGIPGIISGNTPLGGDGIYTYQWQSSTDGVTFTNIPAATAKDYGPPVITATMYYQRLILSGTCTKPFASNIISIQILPALANNIITAPAVTHFCISGDPGLITGNLPTGGNGTYTYQWQSSTDKIVFADINGATASDYNPPVISSTMYYRRTITSGPCSTGLNSNIVIITQDTMPIASAGTDTTICLGDGATLHPAAGTSYSWSPGIGLSNTTIANPVASPLVTTTYTVIIFNNICSTTASVTVNVIQKPTVNAGTDQKIVNGQTAQLNGTVTGSNVQYHWSPAIFLNNPNSLTPIASPDQDITYSLVATSANGCFIISDDVFIKVFPKLVIPNTFTPNADGVNDTWDIPALNSYPNCLLTVYSRYGSPLFKSTGYPKPWDGTYNGKPVPAGTYYYLIDLKDGSKIISGWVAVIR